MIRLFIVSIFLLFLHFAAGSHPPHDSLFKPLIQELKKRIPAEMDDKDVPGLSIALVDKDGLIWQSGFGYADQEAETKATSQTIYRPGSLSKLFTSVAVMQLVEKGAIHLDSTIQNYIADFSMKSRFSMDIDPPTIRELLTHYSGLPGYYIKGVLDENPSPLKRYVKLLSDEYYAFKPNSVYCYSGTGYALLGLLIKEITGMPFAKYMEEEILKPLNMDFSSFERNAQIQSDLSAGYMGDDKRQQFPIRDVPAGGLYSNVEDLAHFMQMSLNKGRFQGRKLLSEDRFEEIVTAQNGNHPLDFSMRIGLGWKLNGIAFTDGKNLSHLGKVAGHGGQTVLFRSKMMMAFDHGVGVVILTNSTNGKKLAWPLAGEVLQKMAALKGNVAANPNVEQQPVHLEPFSQQKTTYYATRWGLMKLSPKKGGKRIKASIPNRKFLFKRTEDGGYTVRYRLFGFLPIKVNQLNPYHFGFVEKAGMDIMVRTSEGLTQFFGRRVKQDKLSEIWQKRTGQYNGKFNKQEAKVIENAKLYVQDGLLMMNLKLPMLSTSTLRIALEPISDNKAYIKGSSRLTGDVLKFVEKDGHEQIIYAGLPLIKEKD